MDPNMVFNNGGTGAERMARFERESQHATEEIAKIDAEYRAKGYRAKGYDKVMSIDEVEEIIMRLMDLITPEV